MLCRTLKILKSSAKSFLNPATLRWSVTPCTPPLKPQKQNVKVSIPDQWNTVTECARPKQPYVTQELQYRDVLDFKHVAATSLRNTKTDVNGQRVSWLKVKWLRYIQREEDTVFFFFFFFKYRINEPHFRQPKTRGTSRRGRQMIRT